MKLVKHAPGKLWIGTSGIALPGPKKSFPLAHQHESRLKYYSSALNSIEINSTFYKLHRPATFKRWSIDTTEDFMFTVKVWKQITHQKKLAYDESDVIRFMSSLEIMESKRGCLLLQFPASITIDYFPGVERLIHMISVMALKSKWRLCVEFRHNSWYTPEVYQLLKLTKSSIVYHDIAKSRPSLSKIPSDTVYLRFHGPEGNYRGSYSDDFLDEYSVIVKSWLKKGKHVFIYFNNTMGTAYANALYLKQAISLATGK